MSICAEATEAVAAATASAEAPARTLGRIGKRIVTSGVACDVGERIAAVDPAHAVRA